MRVLLADDHPIIISGLKCVLSGTNYEIAGAVGDGQAVLDTLETLKPDILLLDISMPKKSGLDVVRTLKDRGQEQKIVLLTGSLDVAAAAEAIELGVDGLLLKENGPPLLLKCLNRVAAGGRWLDRDVMQQVLESQLATANPAAKWSKLTPREKAVADLVAQGLPNKTIAAKLCIAEGTVKVYLSRIFEKCEVASRTELALHVRDESSSSRITGRQQERADNRI
jgi:two-component system, NarL family, nitrate/nitrite response regulator NarL